MSEAIGLAVVGTGYWGPNLVRNAAGAPGANLTAICDLDADRLARIGRLYPGTRQTRDFAEVLTAEDVQAIVIATPAASHHDLAKRAMEAGKDVLVEKPLALTVEECRDLVAVAKATNRVLMTGHTFLFNAAVAMIKDRVDSGEIGELLYVYSSRVNLGRVRQDVNALWNVAPHDISIVNHVLGEEPIRVTATGRAYLQPGIEDVAFAVFEYPGGALAHVHSSWLDPSKVRKTTFVGTQKMIVYDDIESEGKVKIYDKGVRRTGPETEYGEFQLRLHSGDIYIPKITFTEPLAEEIGHFVRCCRDRSRPISDGRNGLVVVAALEAAQRSMREHGRPVDIELDA
ncbi:MAG: Gfo/Idh/MocA family oxidoreductase [Gemmatimonadetes bacterium]|nr:Gfo/Idh/MocA family oxidoreductase [Gemmatimonadota bacterium]